MIVDDVFTGAVERFAADNGLTQIGLAERWRVTQPTISRWMNKHSAKVDPEVWQRIRCDVEPYMFQGDWTRGLDDVLLAARQFRNGSLSERMLSIIIGGALEDAERQAVKDHIDEELTDARLYGISHDSMRADSVPGFDFVAASTDGGSDWNQGLKEADAVARVPWGGQTYGHIALHVEGDSMLPAYRPGDWVICETGGEKPVNGQVVVVSYKKEVKLKYLRTYGSTMILRSENPAYQEIEVDEGKIDCMYPVVGMYRGPTIKSYSVDQIGGGLSDNAKWKEIGAI